MEGGGEKITAFILPAGAVMLLKSLWLGIPNCSNARQGEAQYKSTGTYMRTHIRPPWMLTGGCFSKTAVWRVFSIKALALFHAINTE